jgi:nucleotide-binding universal stress UspA family protein
MVPFRRILVAADFSDSSRQAFRAACSLSRVGQTQLVLLHVMEPEYSAEEPVYFGQQTIRYIPVPRKPEELDPLNERMRTEYVPDRAMDVKYQTVEGPTADEIVRYAEKEGCDLIVMGTHGRTGLRRLLTGSVAETVLRAAHCPVLALRSPELPRPAELFPVILHPTDFSECSEPALQVARDLARDQGARLVVLHVTPTEVVLEGATAAVADPLADSDTVEKIRERVDGSDLKHPVEVRLGRGEAAAEILRAAGELGCGLIVLGTHGRTGLGRLLMGSVAEDVLRKAACPVLAMKTPRPASAPD